MTDRKRYDIGTIEGVASLVLDLIKGQTGVEFLVFAGANVHVLQLMSTKNRYTQ